MSYLSSAYRQSLVNRKNLRWKQKYFELANDFGVSPSSSASLLIDDENDSLGVNCIKEIGIKSNPNKNHSPIIYQPPSFGQYPLISRFNYQSITLPTCQILQVYKATTNSVNNYSNQTQIKLQWIFEQLIDIQQSEYHLINPLEIKSIIQNHSPIAYKYQQLIQEYCYVVQLHKFNRKSIKHYLSVIVTYVLKGQYFLPQISCFLSNQQPNINQILLQKQTRLPINMQKIFNKLDVQRHINCLYMFYKYTCGMSFIDDLILQIMLQKSILIKGKSNKYISQFVYLLSHYSKTPLCHVINYQIMDVNLLDLPSPFIFGSSDPTVMKHHNQSVYIINLDNCTFQNIPKIKRNLGVRQFVAHLYGFVEYLSDDIDQFQIIKIVGGYFQKDEVGLYMLEYVKTMGFHKILQNKKDIILK